MHLWFHEITTSSFANSCRCQPSRHYMHNDGGVTTVEKSRKSKASSKARIFYIADIKSLTGWEVLLIFSTRVLDRGVDGPPSVAAQRATSAAVTSATVVAVNGRLRPPWSWCHGSGAWTTGTVASSSQYRHPRRPRCPVAGGWASRPRHHVLPHRHPSLRWPPETGPGRYALNGWAWLLSCTRPPYRPEISTRGGPRPRCKYLWIISFSFAIVFRTVLARFNEFDKNPN